MVDISTEAAAHMKARLDEELPILRDQNVSDDALKDVLIDLYKAGLCDGRAKVEPLLRQITQDLTDIVVAFLAKDTEGLAKAVGEFVDRRVLVNYAESSHSTQH